VKIQSKHENFNIGYDEVMRKFFILSKTSEIEIGGFRTGADAIEFALKRVKA